jgi:hypothetical protein
VAENFTRIKARFLTAVQKGVRNTLSASGMPVARGGFEIVIFCLFPRVGPAFCSRNETTGFRLLRFVCEREARALRRRRGMETIALTLPLAAVGYSLVYLLAGGGLGGAILIFIVAKVLGR